MPWCQGGTMSILEQCHCALWAVLVALWTFYTVLWRGAGWRELLPAAVPRWHYENIWAAVPGWHCYSFHGPIDGSEPAMWKPSDKVSLAAAVKKVSFSHFFLLMKQHWSDLCNKRKKLWRCDRTFFGWKRTIIENLAFTPFGESRWGRRHLDKSQIHFAE